MSRGRQKISFEGLFHKADGGRAERGTLRPCLDADEEDGDRRPRAGGRRRAGTGWSCPGSEKGPFGFLRVHGKPEAELEAGPVLERAAPVGYPLMPPVVCP